MELGKLNYIFWKVVGLEILLNFSKLFITRSKNCLLKTQGYDKLFELYDLTSAKCFCYKFIF